MISLSGNWKIEYETSGTVHDGSLFLPGTMQAAGFGNSVTEDTEFVSSLHDPDWFEREEFKSDSKDLNVPFLSKPRRHFVGVCAYERNFELSAEEAGQELYFFGELIRRKSLVYVDGVFKGSYESYCAPHIVSLGRLEAGIHSLRVEVDNRLFPGFRPDAHTVTDGVGASWNGIVGEIALFSAEDLDERYGSFKKYAEEHPRKACVSDGNFIIDGKAEYIRGTHFGGDYPRTGYPSTDKEYYLPILERLKDWGFNLVRCHSFCPPEAMFSAADECGMYILAECGMWSTFNEGLPVIDFLNLETEAILREFGHHPSFVMLSPSNEPGGNWYNILRNWVKYAKETDEKLGYGGRRLFTAQSGWFYDTKPSETEGTDFLYFHRSAYGPLKGGTVRNPIGWNGKNYSPSLEGVKLPVVCHELGQWCAYPDFKTADRFTGFLKPSNYKAFENLARKNGLLDFADDMHLASGKNQMRLLKEEFEANYRTPELKGYEYLDAHDYPGQGTAFVGVMDAFFEPKAYADKDYFRQFNSEDVLTAAFESYTLIQGRRYEIPVALSHYSDSLKERIKVRAELLLDDVILHSEESFYDAPARGSKVTLGNFAITVPEYEEAKLLKYRLSLENGYSNSWDLFAVPDKYAVDSGCGFESGTDSGNRGSYTICRTFNEVFKLLDEGRDVLFLPDLSELNFDCASVNNRSVYWNAQMGPKWERSLGILADTDSPFVKYFPTDKSGGFQWGPILRAGRGIAVPGSFKPIVRVIDDWNRSIPMAFLLEAKVSKGRLLMSAFDKDAADTPETRLYFHALTRYISSSDFNPQEELAGENLKDMFFPVNRMKELTGNVTVLEGTDVSCLEGMVLSNPNIVTGASGERITFDIKLKKQTFVHGFVWLDNQRKRMRDDFAKNISVTLKLGDTETFKGDFLLKNTVRQQTIGFDSSYACDTVRLTVLSTYGRESVPFYDERPEGFVKIIKKKEHKVSIAAFHLLTNDRVAGVNTRFWDKNDEVLTREIDI